MTMGILPFTSFPNRPYRTIAIPSTDKLGFCFLCFFPGLCFFFEEDFDVLLEVLDVGGSEIDTQRYMV